MPPFFILPEDASQTSYFGWLNVQNRRYMFRIIDVDTNNQRGDRDDLRRAKLVLSNDLLPILSLCEDTLQSMLLQSNNLNSFLFELNAIVCRILSTGTNQQVSNKRNQISGIGSSNNTRNETTTSTFFTQIAEELTIIGWDNVRQVDDNFQQLELACPDSNGRTHIIRVDLPPDYPNSPPTCTLNVPDGEMASSSNAAPGPGSSSSFAAVANNNNNNNHSARRPRTVPWLQGNQTLSAVLSHARQWLNEYNDFWTELDDFDSNTWILEPVRPSRSDVIRRIALRRHCSVEIRIKPDRPRDVCSCTFIGPEHIVATLRDAFHSGQRTWDSNLKVRTNMEKILGQPFPSPATSNKSDFSVECGVCYAYRLEYGGATVLPDTTCESCGQHFHANCIGEWLQALPSTRRSFNVLFGSCPYCTKPLSVNV